MATNLRQYAPNLGGGLTMASMPSFYGGAAAPANDWLQTERRRRTNENPFFKPPEYSPGRVKQEDLGGAADPETDWELIQDFVPAWSGSAIDPLKNDADWLVVRENFDWDPVGRTVHGGRTPEHAQNFDDYMRAILRQQARGRLQF